MHISSIIGGKSWVFYACCYWENLISNERDWLQHIEYIHNNPVKHGYVNHPEEWLYSSYHRYKKMGIL